MEYLEELNLYMCDTFDGILDILNDPCYSKVFKDELKKFLESKEAMFSFTGDVRISDPSSQGVLVIKANEECDSEPDDDGIVYLESICKPSDLYYSLQRNKAREIGNFFKPFMKFIKINFA